MEDRHQIILEILTFRHNLSLLTLLMLCLLLSSVNALEAPSCSGTGDVVNDVITEDFSDLDGSVSCSANLDITLGDPSMAVSLFDGAVVTLTAKKIGIQPMVTVETGATLTIVTRTLLNDTGIVDCADDSSNGLTCPQPGYPEQDAEHGRDVIHTDNANGHAGFNFTKLDASGNPTSAGSWNCVKDNVTGLIWEVKTDDGGLHDRDDQYYWYNTDSSSNGGAPGKAGIYSAICFGYDIGDSATFCNTQAYVARVNQVGWCGANDWRMPTKEELRSLVDYSADPEPAIDTGFFPNDKGSYVWSSSPSADDSVDAWRLYFNYGDAYPVTKLFHIYVRLVHDRH